MLPLLSLEHMAGGTGVKNIYINFLSSDLKKFLWYCSIVLFFWVKIVVLYLGRRFAR